MKYRKIMTAIASMTMAGVMLAGAQATAQAAQAVQTAALRQATAQLLRAAANPPPAARRLASRYGVRRRIRN